MKAAGLLTNALGKRYTDEDCFENLLAVWTHYGRAPLHREMSLPPSSVGSKAYIRRFGTWTKALQAFVDGMNKDSACMADTPTNDEVCGPIKSLISDADVREIKLGLRYTVLKRDSFRCVTCGRSPATHLGIVLHVDHIVPAARGGKTVIENLRCLCADCNLGKGARP